MHKRIFIWIKGTRTTSKLSLNSHSFKGFAVKFELLQHKGPYHVNWATKNGILYNSAKYQSSLTHFDYHASRILYNHSTFCSYDLFFPETTIRNVHPNSLPIIKNLYYEHLWPSSKPCVLLPVIIACKHSILVLLKLANVFGFINFKFQLHLFLFQTPRNKCLEEHKMILLFHLSCTFEKPLSRLIQYDLTLFLSIWFEKPSFFAPVCCQVENDTDMGITSHSTLFLYGRVANKKQYLLSKPC